VGAASGEWRDANAWKRTSDGLVGNAQTILGAGNGSNGADSTATSGENIVIGGGKTVEYVAAVNGETDVAGRRVPGHGGLRRGPTSALERSSSPTPRQTRRRAAESPASVPGPLAGIDVLLPTS